jgi:tetratricopeptide (TPR) repeat protein
MVRRNTIFAAAGLLLTVVHVEAQSNAVREAQSNAVRERAQMQYRIGWNHFKSEEWEQAARAFQEATETDPEYELAYYMLGRAKMPQKKYAEAIAAYKKCRDLYQAQSGRQFSSAQEAQRYRRDRVTQLDELIRQVNTGPQTAQTQEQLRQLNEQKRQLQDIISRGNNVSIDTTVPAWIDVALGSAYFRAERFADAERAYKAAIATDPKAGEAHSNLAVVYLTTGRAEEAEKEIKLAEKAGFRVNPMLKNDIAAAKKKSS